MQEPKSNSGHSLSVKRLLARCLKLVDLIHRHRERGVTCAEALAELTEDYATGEAGERMFYRDMDALLDLVAITACDRDQNSTAYVGTRWAADQLAPVNGYGIMAKQRARKGA